jgi:hypothetical protein
MSVNLDSEPWSCDDAKQAFRDNGALFKVELVCAIPEDQQIKISARPQIWSSSSTKSTITAALLHATRKLRYRSYRFRSWSRP